MLLRAADRNDAADALDDARIGWDDFRTARGNENALGRSSPGSWSSTWEVPRRRSKLICGRQPQMSPTYDKTGTTAYVLRDHDTKLREALAELKEPGARPRLITVVGTSCSGKTRTFYKAVRAVLADWNLVKPADTDELTRMLYDGVPSRTVVWLDELQDFPDNPGSRPNPKHR